MHTHFIKRIWQLRGRDSEDAGTERHAERALGPHFFSAVEAQAEADADADRNTKNAKDKSPGFLSRLLSGGTPVHRRHRCGWVGPKTLEIIQPSSHPRYFLPSQPGGRAL